MFRAPSTTRQGTGFTLATIDAVWSKAQTVLGYDPRFVRVDSCGAYIEYRQYGNTNSTHGWEIDHIYPASRGGNDNLDNLQPLQWQNNRRKADALPGYWSCAIGARAASYRL